MFAWFDMSDAISLSINTINVVLTQLTNNVKGGRLLTINIVFEIIILNSKEV